MVMSPGLMMSLGDVSDLETVALVMSQALRRPCSDVSGLETSL